VEREDQIRGVRIPWGTLMDRLVGIVGALTTMESWPNKIQPCPNGTPRARAQVRTQAYRKWLIRQQMSCNAFITLDSRAVSVRFAYTRARERAASEPDEVRGRVDRAAAIAKGDGGCALRAFPKNKKRNS